jgi:hypothetical protein
VLVDYILCILFVFPALCLYDRWKQNAGGQNPNCCVEYGSRRGEPTEVADEDRVSLIRRILSAYYNILHVLRYPLLLFFAVTFAGSAVMAVRLSLPNSSGVRLLAPESDLEQQFQWRLQLFGNEILRDVGSAVHVVWGVTPSDTGSHNDPDVSSVLVIDESFDPVPATNQLHLLNFCNGLFENEFVNPEFESYVCPMALFDTWLKEQAELNRMNTASDQYTDHCGNSTGVPVDASVFHPCFVHFKDAIVTGGSSWGVRKSLEGVLSRAGLVRIVQIPFKQSGVRWDIGT